MQKGRSSAAEVGEQKVVCTCGGRLWSCGNGAYICDHCELEWFQCELCSGALHACQNQELIFHPNPSI